MKKTESWYIHAVLTVIIAALTALLIYVAIIEPNEVIESENYWRTESRLRMSNLKSAEILWEAKHKQYTDNLDSLIHFLKTDVSVQTALAGWDTITKKSTNPFDTLSNHELVWDSLYRSPKTFQFYKLAVDTSVEVDTVINRRGRIVSIDTLVEIGKLYKIDDPDGYGSIGDLNSEALKHAASWE
jgi:hypothetical protein